MGLELQVRGVTSAMPMNCAAAVTMADGALQPACGCLISRILHHCTALCEIEAPQLWLRCLSLSKPGNCRSMSDHHAIYCKSETRLVSSHTYMAMDTLHCCLSPVPLQLARHHSSSCTQ